MKITKLFLFLVLSFIIHSSISSTVLWRDLPEIPIREIINRKMQELGALEEAVQYYQSLDKTQWSSISARIHALENIINISDRLNQKIDDDGMILLTKQISILASNKKKYLQELIKIHENFDSIKQQKYAQKYTDSTWIPLTVSNKITYNYSRHKYEGGFFIEAIDPSHRRFLHDYYQKWKKVCLQECELPDFFLWLEDKTFSNFHPFVKVYSNIEDLKVLIKDHVLFISDGKTLLNSALGPKKVFTEEGEIAFHREHIFIINQDEEIFATYSGPSRSHASLSNYEPVIGCGSFIIKNGKITFLSGKSGHYLPNFQAVMQMVNIFIKKGYMFDDSTIIQYFDDRRKVTELTFSALKAQLSLHRKD